MLSHPDFSGNNRRSPLRSIANRVSRRLLIVHGLAAVFVVINWGTFIWASIHGHVLESGLGYLLAPFVAIAVSTLFLGDKINPTRSAALITIAVAVGYLLQSGGDLAHWVYITIGVTWPLATIMTKKVYEAVKKSGLVK